MARVSVLSLVLVVSGGGGDPSPPVFFFTFFSIYCESMGKALLHVPEDRNGSR